MGYNEDSTCKRIGKCFLSAFIAGLFGVVVAEVVANSLVELSVNIIFSVVFGVAFAIFSAALLYISITSVHERAKRIFMLCFSFLVFASGVFCIVLQERWVHVSEPRAKSGMYAVVGLSLSFALSFSFTEFINLGLCDRCCKTDFENNPITTSRKQVALIFVGTTLLGVILGLLFGLDDVENDDARHDKFTKNLIVSLPLGAGIGAVIGFLNQWFRSVPDSNWASSRIPIINADDEI